MSWKILCRSSETFDIIIERERSVIKVCVLTTNHNPGTITQQGNVFGRVIVTCLYTLNTVNWAASDLWIQIFNFLSLVVPLWILTWILHCLMEVWRWFKCECIISLQSSNLLHNRKVAQQMCHLVNTGSDIFTCTFQTCCLMELWKEFREVRKLIAIILCTIRNLWSLLLL